MLGLRSTIYMSVGTRACRVRCWACGGWHGHAMGVVVGSKSVVQVKWPFELPLLGEWTAIWGVQGWDSARGASRVESTGGRPPVADAPSLQTPWRVPPDSC
jgi:hypothetical protein